MILDMSTDEIAYLANDLADSNMLLKELKETLYSEIEYELKVYRLGKTINKSYEINQTINKLIDIRNMELGTEDWAETMADILTILSKYRNEFNKEGE
ncbi:MAG: hypothetical protein IJ115_02120 [Erysipelotrichaceae bacterium]|nr:hypothetical protein [Erysipelotrichaceae bacterium]